MDEDIHMITGGPLKLGEYIAIKREMSAADEAWIQDHASRIGGTKKNPIPQLTAGQVKLAALKRMIVRWQITKTIRDREGNETPIPLLLSEQAIEELPRRISAYVAKIIDELNPEEDEDEDFTGAANGHSEGSSAKMSHLLPRG